METVLTWPTVTLIMVGVFTAGWLVGRSGSPPREPTDPGIGTGMGAPRTTIPDQLRPRGAQPVRDRVGEAIANMPDAAFANVQALALGGRKIEAIKLLRDTTRLDLRESKDAMERIASGSGGRN